MISLLGVGGGERRVRWVWTVDALVCGGVGRLERERWERDLLSWPSGQDRKGYGFGADALLSRHPTGLHEGKQGGCWVVATTGQECEGKDG